MRNEQEGDIVVNVADTLERWTNGVVRAGIHRVVPPNMPEGGHEDRENRQAEWTVPARRSAVMFYRAKCTTSVGPMTEFVTSQRPPQYDEITAMQYLQLKNEQLY